MDIAGFLDETPVVEETPEEEDDGVSVADAIRELNPIVLDILRISGSGYGSYMEVAYEWSWEEGLDVLEILDIQEEKQRRNELRSKAESIAGG